MPANTAGAAERWDTESEDGDVDGGNDGGGIWQEREFMVLSDAHALLGDDWAGIAARLPGKTADDVRLYFQANPSDDGDWRWDKAAANPATHTHTTPASAPTAPSANPTPPRNPHMRLAQASTGVAKWHGAAASAAASAAAAAAAATSAMLTASAAFAASAALGDPPTASAALMSTGSSAWSPSVSLAQRGHAQYLGPESGSIQAGKKRAPRMRWSAEQNVVFASMVAEHGPNWGLIVDLLNAGRPQEQWRTHRAIGQHWFKNADKLRAKFADLPWHVGEAKPKPPRSKASSVSSTTSSALKSPKSPKFPSGAFSPSTWAVQPPTTMGSPLPSLTPGRSPSTIRRSPPTDTSVTDQLREAAAREKVDAAEKTRLCDAELGPLWAAALHRDRTVSAFVVQDIAPSMVQDVAAIQEGVDNLAPEAAVLLAKATEFFVHEAAILAHYEATKAKRHRATSTDVTSGLKRRKHLAFLPLS